MADTGRVRGGLHIDSDFRRMISECQSSKRGRIKEVYGILSNFSRIETASKPHRNRIETVSNTPDSNALKTNWMHTQTLAGWAGGATEAGDVCAKRRGSQRRERTGVQPASAHPPTHGASQTLAGWAGGANEAGDVCAKRRGNRRRERTGVQPASAHPPTHGASQTLAGWAGGANEAGDVCAKRRGNRRRERTGVQPASARTLTHASCIQHGRTAVSVGNPEPVMSARSGGGAGAGLPSLTDGGGGGRGYPLRGDGRGGVHSATRQPDHAACGYARDTTHVYPFWRV